MKNLAFITVLALILTACGGDGVTADNGSDGSITGSGRAVNFVPADGFADAVSTLLDSSSDVARPVMID